MAEKRAEVGRVSSALTAADGDKAEDELSGSGKEEEDEELSRLAEFYLRSIMSPPPPDPPPQQPAAAEPPAGSSSGLSPPASPRLSPSVASTTSSPSSVRQSPFISSALTSSPRTPSFLPSVTAVASPFSSSPLSSSPSEVRGSSLRASAPPFNVVSSFSSPLHFLPSSASGSPSSLFSSPVRSWQSQSSQSSPAQSSPLSALSASFTSVSAPHASTFSFSSRHLSSSPRYQPLLPLPSSLPVSPLLSEAEQVSSSSPSFASSIASSPLQTLLASLPVLPFDVPSDRELLSERAEHASYMLAFRTSVCPLFAASVCPQDAYSCFHAHSRLPRRRRPLLQHGRYSYIPTRCRYVMEDRDCPKGAHCRFAHSTEEVIYHPSKYKTQLCSHQLDDSGVCSGYGLHCAKAHGEDDRREAVYEQEEGQQQHRRWRMDDLSQFVCPASERETERLFYTFVYKTRRCAGFPFNCQCDGLDFHRDEERRRGPAIRYAPMPCPKVKPFLNADWGDPNVDCSGRHHALNAAAGRVVEWDCDYAHTLLELMVYKTSLCVAEGQTVGLACGAGLQVERLQVGDEVMAWDGQKREMVATEVLAVLQREGERHCVELRFEDGRTLRCTPDHQLLTDAADWVEASQLQVGQSRLQMSTLSPLLFPSSLCDAAATRRFTYRLSADPRYLFSCSDRDACFRFCAVARVVGLMVTADVQVEVQDEDEEAETICSVRRWSALDAARLASDLRLVTGEMVKERRVDDGQFAVQLPASLVSALLASGDSARSAACSSPPPSLLQLPSLLTDAATPDAVFKECLAGLLGGGSELTAASDAELRFSFRSHTDPAGFRTATRQLSALLLARGFPSLQLDDDNGGKQLKHGVFRISDAAAVQQRIGVRYNAAMELQLATIASRGSMVMPASSSAASASLPCYSLVLVSRRAVGRCRVLDVSVRPSLQSFVCSGVVVHNCDHFDALSPSTWRCVWKRRCAHAHGRDDLKSKDRAAEEWKQHLAVIGTLSAQTALSLHLSPSLQPPAAAAVVRGGGRAAAAPTSRKGRDETWQTQLTAPLEPQADSNWSETDPYSSSGAARSQRIGSKRVRQLLHSLTASLLPSLLLLTVCCCLPSSAQRLSLFDLAAPASSQALWESPSQLSSPTREEPLPIVMSEELIAAMQSSLDTQPVWPDTAPPAAPAQSLLPRPVAQSYCAAFGQQPAPRRSPSPSLFSSSPLLSAASVLAPSDSGLVPLTVDERLAYDPQHVLSVGKDGLRLYAGYCSRAQLTTSRGHCGIVIIDRSACHPQCYAAISQQADALLELTQEEGAVPQLMRYLDREEGEDRLCIAVELYPDNIALHEALPAILQPPPHQTNGSVLQPVSVIQQLLTAVTALHSRGIAHGAISPKSLFVDPLLRRLRLGDVRRRTQPPPADSELDGEQRVEQELSADVYAVGCVGFYLFSGGRTPFAHAAVAFERWPEAALASPFDTSIFHPTAAHFLSHLLLAPPSQRMTAQAAAQHPLFWSPQRGLRFLCSLSHWVDEQLSTAAAADSALHMEVQEFVSELESLSSCIFPTSASGVAEWLSSVHSSLHRRHLAGVVEVDALSVLSLLRFMQAVLLQLQQAPLVSCLLHALFHLDHRSNCTRPRKQLPDLQAAKADDDAQAAVGSYFFARFPSLLITVYHLAHRRWQTAQQRFFIEYQS